MAGMGCFHSLLKHAERVVPCPIFLQKKESLNSQYLDFENVGISKEYLGNRTQSRRLHLLI